MNEQHSIPPETLTVVNTLLAPYGAKFTPPQDKIPEQLSENRCMSEAEAEKYCGGISYWTLRRAHERGELPVIKLGTVKNTKILFEKTALDKWLTSKRNKGGEKVLRFPRKVVAHVA